MAVKESILIVLVVTIACVVNDANALSCVKCDDKPCEVKLSLWMSSIRLIRIFSEDRLTEASLLLFQRQFN